MSSPGRARAGRRAATLNEQLDALLEKFQFTNAAFHAAYQTARSIVDHATGHEVKKSAETVALPKAA